MVATVAEFTPTDEQAEAVRLAMTGGSLTIEAGAGVGKSQTLKFIAKAKGRDAKLTYWAFNSAIVKEAKLTFPINTECVTSHGAAYKTHGAPMRGRLNGARMRSGDIARALSLDPLMYAGIDGPKRAAPGWLAGFVMKGVGNFCQSADPEPNWRHVPTPDAMKATLATRNAWDEVRKHLEPKLKEAWTDLCDRNGRLNFTHDVYRKQWALSNPRIQSDVILLDEAQDSARILLGVIDAQRDHAQIVLVGDANQAIYGFAGAHDAMSNVESEHHATLSHSFRFGQDIADEANDVLAMLPTSMRLVGAGPQGRVGRIEFPDVILTRTNSVAVANLFQEIDRGGKPHIVGGATDVIAFCRGADKLMEQGWSDHPELVCFDSWMEVQQYVSEDVLGEDLKMLVKLVDEYGAAKIVSALEHMPPQDRASLVLSTAHKSKGLGFGSVKLTADFPDGNPERTVEEETLRLLYVAVTRAKTGLDVSEVGLLRPKVPTDRTV